MTFQITEMGEDIQGTLTGAERQTAIVTRGLAVSWLSSRNHVFSTQEDTIKPGGMQLMHKRAAFEAWGRGGGLSRRNHSHGLVIQIPQTWSLYWEHKDGSLGD